MYGQELNPESYAICKADMLIKGQDISNIIFGNTLSPTTACRQAVRLHAVQPALRRGVEEDREGVREEHEQQGYNGRFGPGLPRVSATARCCSCCT
jgi:type I restriction enzyme M protein